MVQQIEYTLEEGIRAWCTLLHQDHGLPWNLTHTPPAFPTMEGCWNWGGGDDKRLAGVTGGGSRHGPYCHLWAYSMKASDAYCWLLTCLCTINY